GSGGIIQSSCEYASVRRNHRFVRLVGGHKPNKASDVPVASLQRVPRGGCPSTPRRLGVSAPAVCLSGGTEDEGYKHSPPIPAKNQWPPSSNRTYEIPRRRGVFQYWPSAKL